MPSPAELNTFLTEWYFTGWLVTSVLIYLKIFFADRGRLTQDGSYGFGLLIVSFLGGFFWLFVIPIYCCYLLTQIPKAINWFIDSFKKEILPSSFDNWT